mmetsp:Transcript_6076/g.12619  ORF Transcript_6076/g.12619 Transcript_6076/m.12619 type:complete len:329 (+) Transcript_6076:205-1191(+)
MISTGEAALLAYVGLEGMDLESRTVGVQRAEPLSREKLHLVFLRLFLRKPPELFPFPPRLLLLPDPLLLLAQLLLFTELFGHLLGRSLVRVCGHKRELLTTSHAPWHTPTDSIYNRPEASAVTGLWRVFHVLLVDLVAKAVVMVAPPGVKFSVLGDDRVVMAAAAQDLRRHLQRAKFFNEVRKQRDRGSLLAQLPVKTRAPRVNPPRVSQRRNHDDSRRVPGAGPDGDDVPVVQGRYGLRFPPAFAIAVAQPPPAPTSPREGGSEGDCQDVLGAAGDLRDEFIPQARQQGGAREVVLFLVRHAHPLPGAKTEPSVSDVSPAVELTLVR